ncbi:hypothetical protein JCM6882_006920 [Rhodosporidiobolus microsporus]
MAAPPSTAGPTAYDQIEHTNPPPSASATNARRSLEADANADERSALLGSSGASRDYRTEARRDRRALAEDDEGEFHEGAHGEGARKRPWSLKIDLAVAVLLLLVNGYFWLMSLIAIKSPFVTHTALPAHRGSMFVPVWVSFLSCTINTASLLSFLYPHESPLLAFYTSLTASFFALVTLILSVSVTQLRVIEGPHTFILLALSIVSLWHSALSSALTDKYAPLLDPPEELDPDSYEATGFWAKVKRGVRAGLGFLGISLPIAAAHIAVLVAFFLLFLNIVLRSVDASVEQPGQRWKVDPWLWQRKYFPELGRGLFQSHGREYRIHLSCRGLGLDDPPVLSSATSSPVNTPLATEELGRPTVRRTILVESDQGTPGIVDADWVLRMLKDGDLNSGDVETRVCFWDRPGYGFSDGSPSSSIPHLVSALTQALSVSGELARLQPPPSLTAADDSDASLAPSPLARSGFVLVSRSRSTALTSLFAALHPRLIHSFLYITPSSPSLVYQSDPLTRFAAIPHFFSRTVPALWSEMGVKRTWWAFKGVSRRRRVLARGGERVSGLIERAGLEEHHERDRGRESDGAKAWERRRGRYPNRPTVVLGKGTEGKDEGRKFVEEVIGEGLREWDTKWDGGVGGCGAGGEAEAKCRESLRGLLALD